MTRDPLRSPAKPGEATDPLRSPAKPDEARSPAKPDEAWRSVGTKRYQAEYSEALRRFRILAQGALHYEAQGDEAKPLWDVAQRLRAISAKTFHHWCRHINRGEGPGR